MYGFNEKKFFNETSTNILGVSLLVQPVETRPDPLQPVETRFNPFRSVQTRYNTFKPVETRFPSLLPLPPTPFSPLFPSLFFLGGGRDGEGEGGEGKPPPPKTPGRGWGGTKSPPPPPQNFNNNKKNYQILSKSSNLQNLCNNLPTYTRGFSLSPLLLKTT